MSLRANVVQWMDENAPRVIGIARYRTHVSLRGDVVFPSVTKTLFKRLGAKQGDALDVGANVGIFSRYFAAHFRQVALVEPVPYLAERLARSVPANCTVNAVALGDADGSVVLRVPVDAQGREMHALTTASRSNNLGLFANAGFVEHNVPMRRLDSIAAGLDALAYVKIDVEGFEGAVLAGATHMLEQQRPVIQLEIGRVHNPNYGEVLALLADKNYCPYALHKDGLHPGAERFIDAQPTRVDPGASTVSGVWDFLFIPEERNTVLSQGLVR